MKRNRQQNKTFGMAALALTMFVLLFATASTPALAQTLPVSFIGATTSLGVAYTNGIDDPINAMATGDFNHDGNLDIVTGSHGGGISLMLGNGDGTFQAPLPVDLPSCDCGIQSVAVGDFNGDGHMDVAVLLEFPTTLGVNIYLGNGAGGFGAGTLFSIPSGNPSAAPDTSLAIGDFNGDGKLDLVAASTYDNVVDVLIGKGDGTFQPAVAYSTLDPNNASESNPFGVTVADFNGDGKPDLAVGEGNGIGVLLNKGDGAFGTAVYYDGKPICNCSRTNGIASADLNHDKKIDIVLGMNNGAVPFLNNGEGVFTPEPVVGNYSPWAQLVAIADINGDGKPDILFGDISGGVRTYLGKGNGTFTDGEQYPVGVGVSQAYSLVVGDFNNDKLPDFAIGTTSGGQVISALGSVDGTFRTTAQYGWGNGAYGFNLAAADFNGDGYPDVVYSGVNYDQGEGGTFAIMLDSSHGVLGSPTFITAGCEYNLVEWVAVGDVNGDGKSDVVVTLENSTNTGCQNGTLAVLDGLGTGKFKKAAYYSTGSSAQAYEVKLADINGDGKLDIVTANGDGTLSVLLNKGNGTFQPATLITSVSSLNPNQDDIVIADFDGDGKADIALATYDRQNVVYILIGNGDGTFGTPTVVTTSDPTITLAAGDFNHDGKMDLIFNTQDCDPRVYPGNAGFVILLGKGDGTFKAETETCTGGSYPNRPPVVADFNGDGKLDVFLEMGTYYFVDAQVGPALYQGNGDGTFTRTSGIYYVGAVSTGAVAADFNNDGMIDIAVLDNDNFYQGNESASSFVTVMQNNSQSVSVSPLSVNYAIETVGKSKAETVILTNDKSTSLSINSIVLKGTDPGDFSAKSNCGTSRLPGANCTITVTFKPTIAGARSATLSVMDAAGTQTVQLVGTGK
jgi:hypothetical protein